MAMASKVRAPKSGFALDLAEDYKHLKYVEWPEDLPGLNHWIRDPNLSSLSKELKELAGRVTDSAIRFYLNVKGSPAPMLRAMLRGDTTDPDTIHALKFALDRQDELETAIKPPKERLTELLMSWLQERKRSLVRSMEAVVVAEEGEFYNDTNREPWNMKSGEMTDGQVEHLRFIFRCVMDRIDAVRVEELDWERIDPSFRARTSMSDAGKGAMPVGHRDAFWRMEESIMGSLTPKAREAALALYYQGRVFNGAWNRMLASNEDENIPLSTVIGRALYLVMQNIDLVWMERPKEWSKEEEERLSDLLYEKRSVAMSYRLSWTKRPKGRIDCLTTKVECLINVGRVGKDDAPAI